MGAHFFASGPHDMSTHDSKQPRQRPGMPGPAGAYGFEQGNYRGNLFHQISTTQICACAVKFPHIVQMPLPKGM